MPRRMKKVKKNVAQGTNQPKLQKKGTEEEEFEFDIGSLSLAELLQLAEGYVDDETEETVLMTRREMNLYIKNKMEEHSKDPNINPFIDLEKQARMLLKEVELKEQQLIQAKEAYEVMYRDQLKFFRHIGIVPKVPTKSVGVSVDFPVLPESLPPPEFLVKGQFYFVDLPSCKILKPSTSCNSASKQRSNTEESKLKSSTGSNSASKQPTNTEESNPKITKPSTSRNSASKQHTNKEESKPKIIKKSTSRNSASKQRTNIEESKLKLSTSCNSASKQGTNTEESKLKGMKPSASHNSASKQHTNTEKSKPQIIKPTTSHNSASNQRTYTEESKPKVIKPSTSRNSASKQHTNMEESKLEIIKPSTSRYSASKRRSNTKESKPKIKVECFDVPSD